MVHSRLSHSVTQSSLLSALILSLSHAQSWSHDAQDQWSIDFPMCGTNDQSPINILPNSQVIYDESVCSPQFNWTVDSSVNTFLVVNTKHTLKLTPLAPITNIVEGGGGGLIVLNGYDPLTSSDKTITASFPNYFLPNNSIHDSFCLDSLHFHWGPSSMTGAEHLIDDKQYPLEVHFVHYSCARESVGDVLSEFATLNDTESGKASGDDVYQLGVVGIFFEISAEDNPAFDNILSDERLDRLIFPLDDDDALDELDIVQDLDLMDIIPADIGTAGYYAYEGSLTTPPCTNILRWHVMNAKAQISEAQMEKFRILMASETKVLAPNYREVQDNVNPVFGCVSAPTSEPSNAPSHKPSANPTEKPTNNPIKSESESASQSYDSGESDSDDDAGWFGQHGESNIFDVEWEDSPVVGLWGIYVAQFLIIALLVTNIICVVRYYQSRDRNDDSFEFCPC